MAHGDRRGDDPLDAQRVQRRGDADHVDDGVERADLVELDVGGVDAVDRALGLGQHGEDPVGHVPHGVGQVGGVEQGADRADRTVLVAVLIGDDVGPRRRDPAALDALERQGVAVDAETAEGAGDGVAVGAGIDEGAEQHVAGDPRRPVDVGDPRRRRCGPVTGASGRSRTPRRSRCRCRRR